MKIKKLLAVALAFVMVLSNAFVASAANGPNRYLGYIEFYNSTTDVFLYNNYTSDSVGTIKGATYDTKTNTLSLNNFNNPTLSLTTNTMGDDFKINLVGENHIQSLSLWGDMHGGSCEFTGTGKLIVNENKLATVAIVMNPEGSSSILKASGSTTITAYAKNNFYSFAVFGADSKNCIVGNASAVPTATPVTYDKAIPLITDISDYETDYPLYIKQGTSNKFTCVPRGSIYSVYQIVECPDDKESYILCPYKTDFGTFVPSDYGLVETGEVIAAKSTGYDNNTTVWADSKGNEFVFVSKWDSETSSSYYQKCTFVEYVKTEDPYGGSEVTWYKAVETDDNTKYADAQNAPMNAGFKPYTGVVEGIYDLTISASPLTIKSGSHTHSYKNVVTKATLSKNGSIVPTCSCGAKKTATAIAYPKTIKLSATSYTYDGKVKKPTVKVTDSKGKTIAASNYTVTYASGRKNVGKYAVKITFKGNYSGTKTLYFTIVPKGTTIASIAPASKAMTVKWKKQTTQTTGYEIQYSTDKNFKKGNKTVAVGSSKTVSKKITKLTGKKKYYVRIRTYKTVSGAKYYSAWSKSKVVTIKK